MGGSVVHKFSKTSPIFSGRSDTVDGGDRGGEPERVPRAARLRDSRSDQASRNCCCLTMKPMQKFDVSLPCGDTS